MIRICVAGATGWVGRSLVPAIVAAPDLELVGAVSRTTQGKPLGEVLGIPDLPLRVSGTVEEALAVATDVLITPAPRARRRTCSRRSIARCTSSSAPPGSTTRI